MTSSLGVTFNSSLEDGEVDDQFSFVLYELCVPLLFGAITFIGLAGNGLVLYAILSRDRMRTVTNLLLLNLAVADLAFVIVVPPFTAYQLATASWPFGSSVCRLLHYLVNVTAYVTVYTLVVIATVRYMTVVHGTQTARFRTRRNAAVAIGCLWVVMAGVNVPVLMSYELRNNECDVIDATTGRRIFATFFAFAYVGPLAVIGFLSAAIVHHIAGGGQRNRATAMFCDGSATAILPTVSIAPITVTVAAPSRAQMASERRRKQVGRLLLLVVALFAALWLPVHIHLLVAYFAGLPGGRFYEVRQVDRRSTLSMSVEDIWFKIFNL